MHILYDFHRSEHLRCSAPEPLMSYERAVQLTFYLPILRHIYSNWQLANSLRKINIPSSRQQILNECVAYSFAKTPVMVKSN